MVSKPLLADLQRIVLEEFGVSLNDVETESLAVGLVGYFETLRKLYLRAGSKAVPSDLLCKENTKLTFN